MLVLLGPPFDGTDLQYQQLSQATGIVAYDLRRKLKPDAWGVVKAIGDELQAAALGESLTAAGYRVAVVDPAVGHDPARRIVPVEAVGLGPDELELLIGERRMAFPYRALLTIVRGEVHIGEAARPSGRESSGTSRAVVPSSGDVAVFREQPAATELDAFQAADLHFITVPWIARIDTRAIDWVSLGLGGRQPVENLDALCDLLSARAGGLRVDRASRASSVASMNVRPPGAASVPPPSLSLAGRRVSGDPRFDAYSRLIGEAERLTRRRRGMTTPPIA